MSRIMKMNLTTGKWVYGIFGLILGISVMVCCIIVMITIRESGTSGYSNCRQEKNAEKENTLIINSVPVPTARIVLDYTTEIGIKFPEIVTAQAVLETGWFKCNQCSMDQDNIFGFILHKEYLPFKDWQQCCRYYKWWQDQNYSSGDYFEFLENVGYATDSTYVTKLKQIIKII